MKRILSLLSISIFIFSCSNSNPPSIDCDNVEDCISKNKFDEARKYQSKLPRNGIIDKGFFSADENIESKNRALFKIISAETKFWIYQNDLVRSLKTLEDLKLIETGKYHYLVSTEEVNTKYYELKYEIIRRYCINGEIEEANTLVQELPEREFLEKENRYISHSSNATDEDTRIAKCLKKYNKIKNGLKKNQEIESFKETSENYYEITTFLNRRDEGRKIINEFVNTSNIK